MINYPEAREEAERLSRTLERNVVVKSLECDCNSKLCGKCFAEGTYYELRFDYCGHDVDDLDACEENDCAVRERVSVDPFAGIEKPFQSLSEVESEREEMEAVR